MLQVWDTLFKLLFLFFSISIIILLLAVATALLLNKIRRENLIPRKKYTYHRKHYGG